MSFVGEHDSSSTVSFHLLGDSWKRDARYSPRASIILVVNQTGFGNHRSAMLSSPCKRNAWQRRSTTMRQKDGPSAWLPLLLTKKLKDQCYTWLLSCRGVLSCEIYQSIHGLYSRRQSHHFEARVPQISNQYPT